MAEAGITANQLPDNDYNGWQLYEAYTLAQFEAKQVPTFAGTYGDSSSPIRFRRNGRRVVVRGKTFNSTPATISIASQVMTLPEGYRPLEEQWFAGMDEGTGNAIPIEVRVDGTVYARGDLASFGNGNLFMNMVFDLD